MRRWLLKSILTPDVHNPFLNFTLSFGDVHTLRMLLHCCTSDGCMWVMVVQLIGNEVFSYCSVGVEHVWRDCCDVTNLIIIAYSLQPPLLGSSFSTPVKQDALCVTASAPSVMMPAFYLTREQVIQLWGQVQKVCVNSTYKTMSRCDNTLITVLLKSYWWDCYLAERE